MSHPERPTRVRYLIVGLATLMSVILYMDRFCLAFFLTYIREDLRLSDQQAGLLLSAFFWTYALGQVPTGWLSDRFGARLMLSLYILLWSLFTGVMGLVSTITLLLLFRFGVGLAQAGAYPTAAGMVSKWAPFSARATFSGIISTGGRIGGYIAPILTAYLLIAFVPLSRSSLLQAQDLLDPEQLVKDVRQTNDTPAGKLAGAIRDLWTHQSATRLDSLPSMDAAALAEALNLVVRDPGLYERVPWQDFALPRQALELAGRPADQLDGEEIARRNRLLLEAAFPQSIRKIYGDGWRPALYIYGLAGVVIAALFWLGVRNRPEQHPLCNVAEQRFIGQGKPASPHGEVGPLPLRYIVRCRSLWLSSLSQVGTNFGWIFLGTWLPEYLATVHRVPIEERGWMTSLPWLIGMAGMLGGGWLTDRLTRALGLRWGRCLPMASTRFVAMAAFLACLVLDSPWLLTAAFCVVAVATDLGTAAVWAFKQDIGGKHVGSVLGWGNMWGNLGAALSPLILAGFVAHQRWDLVFVTCAAAFFVAGVAALGVDATIPVVPPEASIQQEKR
jgi:MFS family permease